MSSTIEEILSWAVELPYWERAGLNLLLTGRVPTAADEEGLLEQLLADHGLAAMPLREVLAGPPAATSEEAPIARPTLLRAHGFKRVNALVDDQELRFAPALTVFFGGNGSGKSGYARVLGSLGYSRGDISVLPDVTKPWEESDVIEVSIDYDDGGSKTICHVVGKPAPELRFMYAFDTTSVEAHLSEPHILSFAPAGLGLLTRLAELTDRVRARLAERINLIPHAFAVPPAFAVDSVVSRALRSVAVASDVAQLESLALMTPADAERLVQSELEIAQIKANDPREQVALLERRVQRIEMLSKVVQSLSAYVSSRSSQDFRSLFDEISARRQAMESIGAMQFANPGLPQVGTEAWSRFVTAARVLADGVDSRQLIYPAAGDVCLLCQQPLSDEARAMLGRLWVFLKGEARSAHTKALGQREIYQRDLETSAKRLAQAREMIALMESPLPTDVGEAVESFLGSVEPTLASWRALLDSGGPIPVLGSAKSPEPGLNELATTLRAEAAKLQSTDRSAQMRDLQREHLELGHRNALAGVLPSVRKFVEEREWAAKAARVGGSTRHITNQYNSMFSSRVTKRYVELFKAHLTELGCPAVVEIETRGKKGETVKRLSVRSDSSVPEEMSTPGLVLSEGERRAIALADFLTEVALDRRSGAIVLDDPVTSLDFDWKGAVAPRLVREAKARQVIVFTHDLHFLWLLSESAEFESVQMSTHWVKRGDDERPGYVFSDNAPSLEREYKSSQKARKLYSAAQAEKQPAKRERLLKEGCGALRTSYEAFVVFEMLNEVVMRFSERISIGRLADVVVDKSICRKVDEATARLSRYIEGHLHSDATALRPLEPEVLLREIEAFDLLRKQQKELRAAAGE